MVSAEAILGPVPCVLELNATSLQPILTDAR